MEQAHLEDAPRELLAADEPPPDSVKNEGGASPFVIVVDHAGNDVPRRLRMLGLEASDRVRHIAWDIGASAVAGLLGDALDAVVIRQNYSRLVIDCNRPPGSPASIPAVSEFTVVPGNGNLSQAEREGRFREIFVPYHARIEAELNRRARLGRPAVLIAMHSFTPIFKGTPRPWHIGLMYRDSRLAAVLLNVLRRQDGVAVGDNEPYNVTDETDYTIPVHGERRDLLHVGIEMRQDLIADENGQRRWAALLVEWLPEAYRRAIAS